MCAANSDVGVVEGGDVLSADEDFFLASSDSIHIGWPTIDTVTSIFVGGYIAVNEQKGFYDGDNIIVVWPAVFDPFLDEGTTLTVEQYMQEVYVIDNTSGIKTHPSQAEFKLFIFSDSWLSVEGIEKEIDGIELYDLSGKKMISQHTNAAINTAAISNGVYVLIVAFADGEKQTAKVFIPN